MSSYVIPAEEPKHPLRIVTAKDMEELHPQVDLKKLSQRCSQPREEILAEGEVREHAGKKHAFFDRGSDILAVAHTDHVQQIMHFAIADLSGESLIFCPRLDDRLGVYTILDLLPKLGINVDVLLTEDEEIGQSTAKDFTSKKQYNWMVEFDRRGDDTVTYCFDGMHPTLSPYFEMGHGSFSDICRLEHLGCKGFNVGVGYHDEHSRRAYFIYHEYLSQIVRFVRFHKEHAESFFPHEPPKVKRYESTGSYRGYDDYDDWFNRPGAHCGYGYGAYPPSSAGGAASTGGTSLKFPLTKRERKALKRAEKERSKRKEIGDDIQDLQIKCPGCYDIYDVYDRDTAWSDYGVCCPACGEWISWDATDTHAVTEETTTADKKPTDTASTNAQEQAVSAGTAAGATEEVAPDPHSM